MRTITKLKVRKLQAEKKSQNKEDNKSKLNQRKKRPQIPYRTKALLQKEVASKCPFCLNSDVDHFEIHHIDENLVNNQFVNLLMLCPICHSKITKHDIEREEVIKVKMQLMERAK